MGLASSFGKEMKGTIRTEVSVDDVLERGEEEKAIFPNKFKIYFCRGGLVKDSK